MAVDNIKLSFDNQYVGEMISPTGKVLLGERENGMEPYHLLFGAIGSCFYATFLSIANKKRLTFERAEIEVSGKKRDGELQTLEYVHIQLVIYGGENEALLRKSAELGTKFCSIHETVSKVADMKLEVIFK